MRGEDLMEAMGGLDEALLEKADSYKAEKRSGFGWARYLGIAACIMLLVGLAVSNIFLANGNVAMADGDKPGQPLPDGDAYKVESLDMKDLQANYKPEKASLYVLAVTGGARFDAICEEINRIKEVAWPELYEEMNVSYAIPILRFVGLPEQITEYYFPQVKNGKLYSLLHAKVEAETGRPLSIGFLNSAETRIIDGRAEIHWGAIYRWLAPLTSQDNPLMQVNVQFIDARLQAIDARLYTGFYVIGDTAFSFTKLSDFDYSPVFRNYTPEIDWQRVKDYGWELEVKKIDLY